MSQTTLTPVLTSGSGAEAFPLGDHSAALLISEEQSGGQFSMGIVRADPNGGTALHTHEHEDETFYVLRGRFEVTIGGEIYVLEPGDTSFAPRNIAHAWKCVSPEGGAFIGIATPGGFENVLAEVSAILSSGVPDAMAKIGMTFARYGVSMVSTPGPSEKVGVAEPVVTRAGSGEFHHLGDHSGRVLLSAAQTGGLFSLILAEVDCEGGVPPHVHTREDEAFYILEGQFSLVVGGRLILAGPGDTVFAPRNISHTWKCISPQGGKGLVLITPGGFEEFFRDLAPFLPPVDETRMNGMLTVAERYGLTMLPPGSLTE